VVRRRLLGRFEPCSENRTAFRFMCGAKKNHAEWSRFSNYAAVPEKVGCAGPVARPCVKERETRGLS